MKSLMYNIDKDNMRSILNSSFFIKEALEKCGYRDCGGNRKTFFKIINEYSLKKELKELKQRSFHYTKKKAGETKKLKIEDVFIENSKHNRNVVKRIIIRENILNYECVICKNNGTWKEKKLVLVLDHINGISNDNRLENLRFLCPNCNSQTDTFCGSNKEEKNLSFIKKRKDFLDSINTMEYGWVKKIQKEWKVSHSQVKRWIKKHYPELKYYER